MTDRPPIPKPIKRAVRQACSFGCVICGYPIYQIDHLIPYAEVERHEADNLCLLCGRHHDEKTRGLLPLERVREARLNPINRRIGTSEVQALHYSGKKCTVRLGACVAYNSFTNKQEFFGAIVILNEELLTFRVEDEQLLLSMILKDKAGDILIHIDDNEMIFKTNLWDIEFVGNKMTIREGHGNITAEIIFNAPSEINVQRATFWNGPFSLSISSKGIFDHNDNGISGTAHNVKYGIVFNSREDFAPSVCLWQSY